MGDTLLGKGLKPGRDPKTLEQHTRDVVDAAEALFGTTTERTSLGTEWLRFFRLDPSADWPRFSDALLAACLFHDWGKANEHMQRVLDPTRGNPDQQYGIRHEHLSVLLLGHDGMNSWLGQRGDIDWAVVLAAVGSHHLRFDHDQFAPDPDRKSVRLLIDHDDFQNKLIPLAAERLGLSRRPTFPAQRNWGLRGNQTTFDFTPLRDCMKRGVLRTKFADGGKLVNAVRAALIAADAAGSGLPREGHTVADWIRDRFTALEPLTGAKVREEVIEQRVADLNRLAAAKGRSPFEWNKLQDACEHLPDRALLLAPCGSGKTLAAWRWIASQLDHRPAQRVLFLYPTRATATEGFKDYVSWAPGDDAALLHGTAGFDLDGMFETEDPRRGNLYDRTDPRLFAVRHWGKRVFSATVDQFLAFLSYGYGPMCLLPLLADSVIVVDEVHSFDRKMFSALLGFLKAFDVPVLCMTATLPQPRIGQLTEAGLHECKPDADTLDKSAGEPRYRACRIDRTEVIGRIKTAVCHEGKRVLWVVNQVSRAQQATVELRAAGLSPLCYHSRFKLTDRVARHKAVMAAIKAGEGPAVAVTTQVCEMSLDIDADLLVTEECPITSLVQRMGRCRRGRGELARSGPGEVLVYKPDDEKVYKPDDLIGLNTSQLSRK